MDLQAQHRNKAPSSPHQCELHAHYVFSPLGVHGAVYYTFVTPGQTVNRHYYTDILQHLWENVAK